MTKYPKATLKEYGYRDFSIVNKMITIFSRLIVGVIIFLLYLPIFVIALQSFNSSTEIAYFASFSFKWYPEIFRHETLFRVIKNTFLIGLFATLISTVLGTLIAIGINALPNKKRQKILFLNNIPVLNADIVTGISLMLVMSFILNMLVNIFQIPEILDLFGFPTMLLAHVFFTLPYVVLSVLPKLKEIDPNLMDAATDLGLKPYRALRKVIVPAIQAGIFSGMLLAFTMSIDDFVVSYFTTGNGYDNFSIWIYSTIGRKNLTPAAYALSTLLTVTTLVVLATSYFIEKKKKGSLKNAKN